MNQPKTDAEVPPWWPTKDENRRKHYLPKCNECGKSIDHTLHLGGWICYECFVLLPTKEQIRDGK